MDSFVPCIVAPKCWIFFFLFLCITNCLGGMLKFVGCFKLELK